MQPKALAEPFWSDIQTLLDRHPVVEATRTGQRHRAIAQTMLRLDHQLSRLLAELDVTGLLQQCHAANPPLPRMRVENLLNSELWQRRDGLFLRAFYVLNRLDGDGKRSIALGTPETPSCSAFDWNFPAASFRGFVPIVVLDLVAPDRRDDRCATGQGYTLFLHPDRIRFSGSDLVWREPAVQRTLSGLRALVNDIAWLTTLTHPTESAPVVLRAKLQRQLWSPLVLPPDQKEALVRLQSHWWLNEPGSPRSLLISGPTGVGKSRAIDCLTAGIPQTPDTVVRLDELLARCDSIKDAVDQLQSLWRHPPTIPAGRSPRQPRILVLEDCEQWFATCLEGSPSGLTIAPTALRAFIRAWDQALNLRDEPIEDADGNRTGAAPPQVLLVATTRHPERLDPALRSRFDGHVALSLPDAACRQELLLRALSGTIGAAGGEVSYPTAEQLAIPAETLTALVSASRGLNGRALVVAVQQANDGRCSSPAALAESVLTRLQHERQRENTTVDAAARWDRLVLPTATRDTLQDLVFQLQEAPALRAAGFKPANAVLLYGPPGTGKTQTARTLANEAGLAFVAASTAELKAGYIGQSGERVRELFATARQRAPSILFLDEIDAVATDRSSSGTDSFNREVVTQLLQELDGVRDHSSQPVLVIAATNRMEALDPALLSRFREKVLMDLPTPAARIELLEILLKPVAVEDEARALMVGWVRDGMIGSPTALPVSGLPDAPQSHRDLDQWVNRVLGMSIRRWRRSREARPGSADSAATLHNLRVTTEDVLANLGVGRRASRSIVESDDDTSTIWKAAA